jgi:hypothetical protein
MYQSNDKGPQILIIAIACLFGFLLLMFIYYLWMEKFGGKHQLKNQLTIPYNSNTIAKQSVGSSSTSIVPEASVNKPTDGLTRNELPSDPNDPDYIPAGFIKKAGYVPTKQVFNVANNIYSYKEAEAVCKAFGAEIATYEQMVEAYKKGANWCNYGWTKGQLALYPTQKSAWLKMQEDDDPERHDDCGNVGINGGYFENPEMLFGVNCYGIKPEPRPHEKVKFEHKTDKEYELEKQIANVKRNLSNLSVLPFNKDKWSNCN